MLTDPAGVNEITRGIIGCGIRVHQALGPGLYEAVYAECVAFEMSERGFRFDTGRAVPVVYKGTKLKTRYYVDFIIEERVVLELKAVEALAPIHTRQLMTQLVLTNLPVGILMNFNVVTLSNGGIRRVINRKAIGEVVGRES
jgi:GxxExxY protein